MSWPCVCHMHCTSTGLTQSHHITHQLEGKIKCKLFRRVEKHTHINGLLKQSCLVLCTLWCDADRSAAMTPACVPSQSCFVFFHFVCFFSSLRCCIRILWLQCRVSITPMYCNSRFCIKEDVQFRLNPSKRKENHKRCTCGAHATTIQFWQTISTSNWLIYYIN